MTTILVVDDRATNREYLVTLLAYAGHHLLEASDGAEALDIVHAVHPDLVIIDILMPTMDGFEFVRQLRADPAIAQTRVVLYTATYLAGEARKLAQAGGVRHIIVKPSEPQEILSVVNAALDKSLPAAVPMLDEKFQQEHAQLLASKLLEKIDALEALNADLEARVAERTHELAEANERLKELDQLKSKFVSDVSHELRQPVTNLRMYLDLLARGKPEKRDHYLTVLDEQADRLTILVESILDLSRLELGGGRVAFTPVNLNEVVEKVVVAHQPRAEAAGLRLVFKPHPELPPVRGEFNQLAQVATNLVANAINYTPVGEVQVITCLDPEPGQVCLQVQDTGTGVHPDDLPHLFERFYRGRRTGPAEVPGNGLGLGIVKEIIDLHAGRIEIKSELGAGSTFRVWLPRAERGA